MDLLEGGEKKTDVGSWKHFSFFSRLTRASIVVGVCVCVLHVHSRQLFGHIHNGEVLELYTAKSFSVSISSPLFPPGYIHSEKPYFKFHP